MTAPGVVAVGGIKVPTGSGLPHWVSVGATAQGIPKPTARRDLPPSAATGAFAPSVTSVPAGSGQAETPVGQGNAASPGPSSGTGFPPTSTTDPVASVRTGLIVEASGISRASGVPMKTPLRPLAFNEAATALY